MTKSIDEWAADKCGFDISYGEYFDIKDPRCREIVREVIKLTTYYMQLNSGKNWTCQIDKKTYGRGKTIEEAEVACITAIYEAEK